MTFRSLRYSFPIEKALRSVLLRSEFEKKLAGRNFCLFFEKISIEATLSENATAAISVLTLL